MPLLNKILILNYQFSPVGYLKKELCRTRPTKLFIQVTPAVNKLSILNNDIIKGLLNNHFHVYNKYLNFPKTEKKM